MRRLVVTGGSGILGSTVATAAATQYDVTATYHSNPVTLDGVECVGIDLTDPDQYDALATPGFDAIIHCAAMTDVDRCEREPEVARLHNVTMTEHLADLAVEAGARFVHISTDAVFDGTGEFYTESSDPAPINVYGQTKLDAEQCVSSTVADSVVVRTNLYGWNVTDGQSLAEWILKRYRNGQPVPAFEDSYVTPIYTGFLAECLLELLERDVTGVLHVAGSDRCNKYEFALATAGVFGYDESLVKRSSIADHDFDAPRGRDLSLSVKRARERLDCLLPGVYSGLRRMKREEP